MKCEITRRYAFEAAHSLPKVASDHKCHRVHGHSYKVVITLEGTVDSEQGWLMDFGDVDDIVLPLIETLDHRYLNDIVGLENPTCELLSVWLWNKIHVHIPMLYAVSVAETEEMTCIYRGN